MAFTNFFLCFLFVHSSYFPPNHNLRVGLACAENNSESNPDRTGQFPGSGSEENLTAPGQLDPTGNDPLYDMAQRKRAAIANIQSSTRELYIARERVAPILIDGRGKSQVPVNATVAVLSVLEVNDVRQTVTTGLYLHLQWQDEALGWNLSDPAHQGVAEVVLPVHAVWTPTLRLGNSPESHSILPAADLLTIHADGRVTVDLPFYPETLCLLDLDRFPYDRQVCSILLVPFVDDLSWHVQNNDALSRLLVNSIVIHSQWNIVSTRVESVAIAGADYRSLNISMVLARETTFYTVCLVLPMALTSYMNTLVFLVPIQSGEKVSFLVSIFVSTSVYVSYFTTVMPRGLDSVPSTMKLLIGVIVQSLLVLLATILVLRRHHQEQQRRQQKENDDSRQDPPPRASVKATRRAVHGKLVRFFLPGNTTNTIVSSYTENTGSCRTPDKTASSASDVFSSSDAALSREQGGSRCSAEYLDRVFFALAFLSNTAFLGLLLCEVLVPDDSVF